MDGPNRLGLALSGGGFRASFFHLGVLRRLAEFDLLRHVTTLSTVSGGSIVAAHYYLRFRRCFEEKKGDLKRQDYIDIVADVEKEFVKGNAADLRNRLLWNPLTHVMAFVLGRGYGRQMARLYTKYFYKKATAEIFAEGLPLGSERYADQGIPLHHAITRLPELTEPEPKQRRLPNKSSGYPSQQDAASNLAEFNARHGLATIPHFVINATCLNTGGPFHFMLNEIGGPETGYIRYDELFMLLQLKFILQSMGDDEPDAIFLEQFMTRALKYGTTLEKIYDEFPETAFKKFEPHIADNIHFYLAARKRLRLGAAGKSALWLPDQWAQWLPKTATLQRLLRNEQWLAIEHLLTCDFGALRRAKVAAWYWLDEKSWELFERRGGFTREEWGMELLRELERIDGSLASMFTGAGPDRDFVWLLLDLYYLRSAEAIGWNAPAALRALTLSDAVAASANFPPVFTPFEISGLFDHERFRVLSLTDGGVHDNQGVEAVIDDRSSYLIASDAGGLLTPDPDPAEARVPMMNRIIKVLMGGVRRAQLRNIHETCRVADLLAAATRTGAMEVGVSEFDRLHPAYLLRRAVVFHMTSNPLEASRSGLSPFEPTAVAAIRTDLDAFNDLEIAALEYQGYQLADRYARWFVDDPKSPFPRPAANVDLTPNPGIDLRRMPDDAASILHGSTLFLGRFTRVHPWSAVVLALVFAVLFGYTHFAKWSQLGEWWNYSFESTPLRAKVQAEHDAVQKAVDIAKKSWREHVSSNFSETSTVAIGLVLWATLAIAEHLVRKLSERRRRSEVDVEWQQRKARAWAALRIAFRWPNLVSLFGLLMFIFTLKIRWLLAILPLWSIPALVVFLIAHHAFGWLWERAGRLKPYSDVLPKVQLQGSDPSRR